MAKNNSNLESMDELLHRLANKLKVGDKASAAEVRAELNRIDEEYNKRELRAFVRDLYKQYSYQFLTVGPEKHRLEYPCVIIDVPPSLQNLDLTQSKVIDEILQPLGKSPEDELINKGCNQSQFSDVLSRLTEIENPQRPAWNGDKFALTQLTYSKDEVRLAYHPAKYYDGIDTCDYLRFELLKAWKDSGGGIAGLDNPLTALPCRNRLHSFLEAKDGEDPIISGRFRAANIAVSTLICYPNRKDTFMCRLYRRSAYKLMVDRNRFHVAPSAMFEPCRATETAYQPRSLYENIVREYVEELFLTDEETEVLLEEKYGWRWPYHTESGAGVRLAEVLEPGEASLHLTGIAVSLVNLRMEILTLLIWHTHEFVDHWIEKMNPNRTEFARPEETAKGTAVDISLDEDGEQLYSRESLQPQNMVIAGGAAFWLGRKLLQERPELLRRTKQVYVLVKNKNDKTFKKAYYPIKEAKKLILERDIVVWEIEPRRFVRFTTDRRREYTLNVGAMTFGVLWVVLDNVGGRFRVIDLDKIRPEVREEFLTAKECRNYLEYFRDMWVGKELFGKLILKGRRGEREVLAKDVSICWVRMHKAPESSELLHGLWLYKKREKQKG